MVSRQLENLFSRLILKDDIAEIGIFSIGNDITLHLKEVNAKITENKIDTGKQAMFLKKTCSLDVLTELSALPDYEAKLEEF